MKKQVSKTAPKKPVVPAAPKKPVVAENGKGSEVWALAEAKRLIGASAIVWCVTAAPNGTAYKAPRYRVGYPASKGTGKFIEEGKYMKGVGASWTAAVAMCEATCLAKPVVVETPTKAPKKAPKKAPAEKQAAAQVAA